jgi:hypothetical protein
VHLVGAIVIVLFSLDTCQLSLNCSNRVVAYVVVNTGKTKQQCNTVSSVFNLTSIL